MAENWTDRTELLIGKQAMEKIKKAKVAVFGIGGVGSFVVEGLARAGVGHMVLIDNDVISVSNVNRQIHATCDTIGKRKIDIMRERIESINPEAIVEVYMAQEMESGEEMIIDNSFSYLVDAVDTVKTKIKLIERATEQNIPILSCMGTGNKLDPTKFEIAAIEKTSVCPLARVMRKELKKRNITKVKVLYSKEEPIVLKNREVQEEQEKVGSISFVPSVAGLIIAGEVIKDIIA